MPPGPIMGPEVFKQAQQEVGKGTRVETEHSRPLFGPAPRLRVCVIRSVFTLPTLALIHAPGTTACSGVTARHPEKCSDDGSRDGVTRLCFPGSLGRQASLGMT